MTFDDIGRRIVGYNLIVLAQADPAAVRAMLPAPLEVAIEGRIMLWWQKHHIFGSGAPGTFIDPFDVCYAEIVVKIPCLLNGRALNYTAMGWTDNENLISAGRAIGIPQNSGRVGMTEFNPADAVFDKPHEGMSLSANMRTVGTAITTRVDLNSSHGTGQEPFVIVPNVGRRKAVDVVRGVTLIDDLYRGWAGDYEVMDFWSGTAECAVESGAASPITPFGPLEAVQGYFFFSRFSGNVRDRGIAHNYLDDDYLDDDYLDDGTGSTR